MIAPRSSTTQGYVRWPSWCWIHSAWGKFAQRSNLVKTQQIDDPQVFFDYLTSDEITVLDANLVSDEILEIRYEYGGKFVQPDPKTNVVIAALWGPKNYCYKIKSILEIS